MDFAFSSAMSLEGTHIFENESVARGIGARQQSLWMDIINRIRSDLQIRNSGQFFDGLGRVFLQFSHANQISYEVQSNQKCLVKSSIPLVFDERRFFEIYETDKSFYGLNVLTLLFRVPAFRDAFDSQNIQIPSFAIIAYLDDVLSRIVLVTKDARQISQSKDHFEAFWQAEQEKFRSLESAFAESQSGFESFFVKTASRINDFVSELEAKIEKFKGSQAADIENIKEEQKNIVSELKSTTEEIDARIRFSSAVEAMENKFMSHSRSYYRWSIALFVLFFAAFLAIYIGYEFTLSKIIPPGKSEPSYVYLPLILIPVAAFAWMIRIVSVFARNERGLLDDAKLRLSLLQTYLALVGDPKAKVENSERLLILNALFRPAPGYQQDDFGPPTFVDVMKEMLKPDKK